MKKQLAVLCTVVMSTALMAAPTFAKEIDHENDGASFFTSFATVPAAAVANPAAPSVGTTTTAPQGNAVVAPTQATPAAALDWVSTVEKDNNKQ